jgi:hypothetical protein
MKSNKYIQTKISDTSNLIGNPEHQHYLKLQSTYGNTQRGGVVLPYGTDEHKKRLVSDINLLNSIETKQLIFSEIIFSN